MKFSHLHVHTEYSTLDGFGNVEAYAKKAAKLGYKYLACTDHGNIDGLIKFQKACFKHQITPILGCELYLIPKIAKTRKNGHLLVLIKNRKGFNNLCKMLTFANVHGYYYKPRVTYDILLKHLDGLVLSTACPQSFINLESGPDLLKKLNRKLGDDLYFEVMPHDSKLQRKHNKRVLELADYYNRKVIATNDCHYVSINDAKCQEILLAIQRKKTWNDDKRWKFNIRTLNLKSPKVMEKAVLDADLEPRFMRTTQEVVDKCSGFTLKQRKIKLPSAGPHKTMERDSLALYCFSGCLKLFGKAIIDPSMEKYLERYEFELDMLEKKDFIRYFLIVNHFVEWCNNNGVTVGPGRGSVGCSLIAYLIGITTIDPLVYDLPFERFIAEDRVDFPDIDIDVEHTKIGVVIKYLESKYGENNIAAISTFSRMKARAAVKDVARVFGVNESETNKFTSKIDSDIEDGLELALETPEGIDYQESYPKVIKYAKKLKGQIRTRSKHAAGIVVSKRDVGSSGRGNIVIQNEVPMINWEKEDTEYMGLMKLDILALKMLSVLGTTRELIKKNFQKDIIFRDIPLDNKEVLADINEGNVTGLFQLTGYATRSLISQIEIENFGDIVDVIALSRPGPLNSGMTDDYIMRKRGETWEPKHEIYETITKKTFGLLVYQEQVMAVINKVAGLPYSTADKVRKVIGKKRNPKEFMKYKKQFINGCNKTKVFSKKEATTFWRGLQNWAKYGFNLAHSVEYATIGYWCAWLKYHYPSEFICASLTYSPKDKKPELVEEAYRTGLELIVPMVDGPTHATDWVSGDDKLYIPFTEVENIGEVKALEAKTPMMSSSLFSSAKPHDHSLAKTLDTIDAYRQVERTEPTRKMKKYFNFRIATNPKSVYPNLYKLFNDKLKLKDLDLALEGDYKVLGSLAKKKDLVKQTDFPLENRFKSKVRKCKLCELRQECYMPVPHTSGLYNVMVIAEAPGYDEDKMNRPLVGKSGKKVWTAFRKKIGTRKAFHVTNVNKCYPANTRNPKVEHIDKCSIWLDKELKRVKPIVAIAFGNNALNYFTNKRGGITTISGTTQWIEEYSMWVCWCVHPSSVFRNAQNKTHFKNGISNFHKTLAAISFKKVI